MSHPPVAHPVSCFDLDLHWSSGRPEGTALAAHVDACTACHAYLDRLDRGAAESVPRWLPSSTPETPRVPWRLGWVAPVGAAVALAAGVMLWHRTAPKPTGESGAYVGVKGTPAVRVFFRRGKETAVWDGRAPVLPGDALAFEIACEGFAHVTVAAPDNGAWTRLAEAACPATASPLPFTLVVDGQPGDERVVVVLSAERLDEGALTTTIDSDARTHAVWVVPFVFAKSQVPR